MAKNHGKDNETKPGKAIKASECLDISAFLWCISATAFTSPTVSPVICKWTLLVFYMTTYQVNPKLSYSTHKVNISPTLNHW